MASQRQGRASKPVNITDADGAALDGDGYVEGILISALTASAAAVTVSLYDNSAASGTVVFSSASLGLGFYEIPSAEVRTGCYAGFSASATGADVTVYVSRT